MKSLGCLFLSALLTLSMSSVFAMEEAEDTLPPAGIGARASETPEGDPLEPAVASAAAGGCRRHYILPALARDIPSDVQNIVQGLCCGYTSQILVQRFLQETVPDLLPPLPEEVPLKGPFTIVGPELLRAPSFPLPERPDFPPSSDLQKMHSLYRAFLFELLNKKEMVVYEFPYFYGTPDKRGEELREFWESKEGKKPLITSITTEVGVPSAETLRPDSVVPPALRPVALKVSVNCLLRNGDGMYSQKSFPFSLRVIKDEKEDPYFYDVVGMFRLLRFPSSSDPVHSHQKVDHVTP